MRLTTALFILIITLIAGSCVTREKCSKYFPVQTQRHDSVLVTVTEKVTDTVIKVSADSSWLKAWIECDSAGKASIRELLQYHNGLKARTPVVNIAGNVLTVECKCDSANIHAILKSRETTIKKNTDTTTVLPPVEIKYIPGWMWFFGITGMVAWGILIIYALILFIKRKFKIQ